MSVISQSSQSVQFKKGTDITYPSFPYYDNNPNYYARVISSYYKFYVSGEIVGWLLPSTVEKMPWTEDFNISHSTKIISIENGEVNKAIETQLISARELGTFKVLKGWRDELYPIIVPDSAGGGLKMERAGTALFGIVTLGVHMTAYTRTKSGMSIWVPRRAKSKQTYGGMLDNTVAGGISYGEEPFESLVREAAEEASLPEEVVRKRAKACGTVSYFHVRDERAGGEIGLLQPEVQHAYDLELPPNITPEPSDDEVERFYLWSVEEVQQALAEGQFKPNCAMLLLDFFVRHGILTAENERDYVEIVSRLHRRMPFPTTSH